MRTIEKSEATDSLAYYAEHSEDFPLVITHHGQPIAVLLSAPNADAETVSLSTNRDFLALIPRSRECHAKEGGISSREMRRRMRSLEDSHPDAGR